MPPPPIRLHNNEQSIVGFYVSRKTSLVFAFPLLLGLVGSAVLVLRANTHPGRLVAEQDHLRWESPPLEGPSTGLKADVAFRLRNTGDGTVNISRVESGCGCTVVDTSQKQVGRGRTVDIRATGSPLSSGERTVPITVYTDSPITPLIDLRLTMKTNRSPPFLMSSDANLSLDEADSEESSKILTVATLEKPGDSRPPHVASTLDGLYVEYDGSTSTPFDETGMVQVLYRYRVFLREVPPGTNSGSLVVTDPWTRNESRHVLVTWRSRPGFSIVPSAVGFSSELGRQDKVSFMIVPGQETDFSTLKIEPMREHAECWEMTYKKIGSARGRLICEVRPKAAWSSRPHKCGLVARDASGFERTVPIRPEGHP